MEAKKSRALKILIPLGLICIVVGIWFLKNSEKDIQKETNINPDFALRVTDSIELEKLKSYGLPIILDFGADACPPCREMFPALEELNEELQGKAIIKFMDVWKNEHLAEGYPIKVVPTQVFIDAEGNPYKPKDTEAMQMTLYSLKETGEHVLTVHEGKMTKEQLLNVLKEMGLE